MVPSIQPVTIFLTSIDSKSFSGVTPQPFLPWLNCLDTFHLVNQLVSQLGGMVGCFVTPSLVPPQVIWVVHFDGDAITSSPIGVQDPASHWYKLRSAESTW